MNKNINESNKRTLESLNFNLGAEIIEAIASPEVLEILINPDTTLWLDKAQKGMVCIGNMPPSRTQMLIALVAAAHNIKATVESPIVEGLLPFYNLRFEGLIAPIVGNPTLSIRKKPEKSFTLTEYVANSIMPLTVKSELEAAIQNSCNILVTGGTGTGKTTLVNALIHSISELCPQDRLVILEDTAELQSASKNVVFLNTSIFISMNDLLKATMRLRPDRILVGEVRGGEALALLKSWNTGHPGGVATVHANSASGGLTRLELLIAEATSAPMQILIGESVDYVLHIARAPQGRVVQELIRVKNFEPSTKKYITEQIYKLEK